jgi:hypothetical protein
MLIFSHHFFKIYSKNRKKDAKGLLLKPFSLKKHQQTHLQKKECKYATMFIKKLNVNLLFINQELYAGRTFYSMLH